jgi:protocatechuate 3,4-dioxygenase beta subunit
MPPSAMSETLVTRRRLLAVLAGAAGFVVVPVRALAQACRIALGADEGPFYPVAPFPETDDLLGAATPPGQVLYFMGRVLDSRCAPVAGATLESWQCDAGGQYDHPRAPKVKALEKGFRYFAKAAVGADGTFRFRTLRPAPYKVFGLERAPHIHVRVKKGSAEVLTTEIYFAGEADERLRAKDQVFQGRGPRKGELVATLRPATEMAKRVGRPPERDALACDYDLTLA